MAKPTLTAEYVRSLFNYDAETGALAWKARPRSQFINERAWRMWNTKNAGRRAGTDSGQHYWRVSIDGRKYLQHRIIWLWATGSLPNGEIDHINRVRTDNRLANLREVDKSENCRNKSISSLNTSGIAGVSWNKRAGKWQAKLSNKHIGLYASKPDAANARQQAEIANGYGR